MNLVTAMKTYKKVTRPNWGGNYFVYYPAGTGPHKTLVDCDYFVHTEEGIDSFSTSIDLYAQDLVADDYLILK